MLGEPVSNDTAGSGRRRVHHRKCASDTLAFTSSALFSSDWAQPSQQLLHGGHTVDRPAGGTADGGTTNRPPGTETDGGDNMVPGEDLLEMVQWLVEDDIDLDELREDLGVEGGEGAGEQAGMAQACEERAASCKERDGAPPAIVPPASLPETPAPLEPVCLQQQQQQQQGGGQRAKVPASSTLTSGSVGSGGRRGQSATSAAPAAAASAPPTGRHTRNRSDSLASLPALVIEKPLSEFAGQTRANALDPSQLDPKRAKRIIANRQSAHRSRMKKLQVIHELEQQVAATRAATEASREQVAAAAAKRRELLLAAMEARYQLAGVRMELAAATAVQTTLLSELQSLGIVPQIPPQVHAAAQAMASEGEAAVAHPPSAAAVVVPAGAATSAALPPTGDSGSIATGSMRRGVAPEPHPVCWGSPSMHAKAPDGPAALRAVNGQGCAIGGPGRDLRTEAGGGGSGGGGGDSMSGAGSQMGLDGGGGLQPISPLLQSRSHGSATPGGGAVIGQSFAASELPFGPSGLDGATARLNGAITSHSAAVASFGAAPGPLAGLQPQALQRESSGSPFSFTLAPPASMQISLQAQAPPPQQQQHEQQQEQQQLLSAQEQEHQHWYALPQFALPRRHHHRRHFSAGCALELGSLPLLGTTAAGSSSLLPTGGPGAPSGVLPGMLGELGSIGAEVGAAVTADTEMATGGTEGLASPRLRVRLTANSAHVLTRFHTAQPVGPGGGPLQVEQVAAASEGSARRRDGGLAMDEATAAAAAADETGSELGCDGRAASPMALDVMDTLPDVEEFLVKEEPES